METNRNHIDNKKKGFTMVELVVVLVIMGIILAIAIPAFIHYWRMAEFRKNEENAKTVYLAAESKMTYYRSSGQWKELKQQILEQGKEAPFDDSKLKGRIYGITLNAGEYDEDGAKDSLVTKIIDEYMYDKSIYDGSIAIEIDIETGEVYSAFYATKCKGLNYDDDDKNDYLTMNKRSYDERKSRLLGYYSTKDTGNVVELDSKKLKINSISLVNSEMLSLEWSSNESTNEMAVDYEMTFYKKGDNGEKTKVFSVTINPQNAKEQVVKDAEGEKIDNFKFPCYSYAEEDSNGTVSPTGKHMLVLDAMMSADLQEKVENENSKYSVGEYSTSIRKLGILDSDFYNPQNIYAEVRAVPSTEGNAAEEYRASSVVTSNTENTMFANDNKEIATFRHLSNIRYYKEKNTKFLITNKKMDWEAVGTGVFDLENDELKWCGNSGEDEKWKAKGEIKANDFPTIDKLEEGCQLVGKSGILSNTAVICNLKLGQDSITDSQKYIGLFGEVKGDIQDITMENPSLTVDNTQDTGAESQSSDDSKLTGVGILSGTANGNISNITIKEGTSGTIVKALLPSNKAAVGGIVGSYTGGTMEKVAVNGKIQAEVSASDQSGIGGLVGYAHLSNSDSIDNCENHADVEGNQASGGIVGRLVGSYDGKSNKNISVKDSENDGLVTSSADSKTEDNSEGKYFGGIVGYGKNALIDGCSASPGTSSKYTFNKNQKDKLLKGKYVGGIIGYGDSSVLNDCSTKRNGYVLGKEYVGGIAGAMSGNMENSITATEIKVTTNASYVIGDSYVGGIVGKNENNSTIKECVNNGVAAGYTERVGGIVGENAQGSTIENCANYVSDYNNTIYAKIREWDAEAKYSGGIAGYNEGNILFKSARTIIKSVSGIVVGSDCVGGIAGYNGEHATLDVQYELIGGRIYASGNCVGGVFGENKSTKLNSSLKISPREVVGQKYVGGIIGKNEADLMISDYKSDNIMGSITGGKYVGGIIGLNEAGKVSIENSSNNIKIATNLYGGGIVGYSEKTSELTIKDCHNEGDIEITNSGSKGIDLSEFTSNASENLELHMVGGIISVNFKTIDGCTNSGRISGLSGIGGIVGLNDGTVNDCKLKDNFGSRDSQCVGGMVGVNLENGVIKSCTIQKCTIYGKKDVGGIVGYNCRGEVKSDNTTEASIRTYTSGQNIGGIVGKNGGTVAVKEDAGVKKEVNAKTCDNVGGIIGLNESTGKLEVKPTKATATEAIVIGSKVTILGNSNVGGIIGKNSGKLNEGSQTYLISEAGLVRAISGNAGGIVGVSGGDINYVKNNSESVEANKGNAGGITAINEAKNTISNATNEGKNIRTSSGHAGGIVAENNGTISDSKVTSGRIYSLGTDEIGAVAAVNTGTIEENNKKGDIVSGSVTLTGNATVIGGIVGKNSGKVQNLEIDTMPKVEPTSISSKKTLTVGGVVGSNAGTIDTVTAGNSDKEKYLEFLGDNSSYVKDCQYIGVIAGENGTSAGEMGTITGSSVYGLIGKSRKAEGNRTKVEQLEVARTGSCYGGVAGINRAKVDKDGAIEEESKINNCEVKNITISITGVYTATSTSSAETKEQKSSHVGGVVGINAGTISGCTLNPTKKGDVISTELCVNNGMVGGIAAYNKGSIQLSGANGLDKVFTSDAKTSEKLYENAKEQGLTLDKEFHTFAGDKIDASIYPWANALKTIRLYVDTDGNGNIGGITAYNGPTGKVNQCMTGKWFIANKSNTLGVGTGGIIGTNESGEDSTYLLNQAFVGRQLSSGATNRFAGGIIGSQNNSESVKQTVTVESGEQEMTIAHQWNIAHCVNAGVVYCYNTNYSGGIIGQWTGNGGNVEDCRNYGNLFTTHLAGWLGASGGVVAQLYHAKSDNEYNIISCRNYGSIYGRWNNSTANCASDSAGILGNVTANNASDVNSGQKYKIQVLDCVNESGVAIYSKSMASGIVGFFSTDDVDRMEEEGAGNWAIQNAIINATANIELRIERCQNYATKLIGNNFVGGIFGDRYGWAGCQKTTVKDCYSVNSSSYNKWGFPIYSFANGQGSTNSMKGDESRSNNYFAENNNNTTYTFTNVRLTETKDGSSGSGSVTQDNSSYTGGRSASPQYAWRFFKMYDETQKSYFIAAINAGKTVSGNDTYIDTNNSENVRYIRKRNGNNDIIGRVLFYTGNTENDNLSDENSITASGKTFSNYARKSYKRIEGIIESEKKLQKPASATAKVNAGKITVTVTAGALPNGKDGEKCDPFKYIISIDGKDVYTMYTEEGSFNIPEGLSGNLKGRVKVRAASMYEEIKDSDNQTAELDYNSKDILPTPKVKAELIYSEQEKQHVYRFVLDNREEYDKYRNWEVKIKIDNAEYTLDSNTKEVIRKLKVKTDYDSEQPILQLVAYAQNQSGSNTYERSAESTESVFMPAYRPKMTLQNWYPQATPSIKVSGTTLDDLDIQITLKSNLGGSKPIETPPIYRAELVGTWKKDTDEQKENVVFASTDMLTVSGGETVADFVNLPEYIQEASDLKVRIWYAESGLGPVYTYYDVDVEEDANVIELTDVPDYGTTDEEEPEYSYVHSTVLANEYDGYFSNYQWENESKVKWLKGIKLNKPELSEDNSKYKFSWTDSSKGAEDAQYKVELTGITKDGERVTIDTSEYYEETSKSKEFDIDCSDWSYPQVELKVTRVGFDEEGVYYIGVSETGTFDVKQALEAPSQPTVKLLDQNDLKYEISWDAITSEEGCKEYQLMIREAEEEDATVLGTVTANNSDKYSIEQYLDKYAGKKVTIYVKAMAQSGSDYINSADGVGYTFSVPEREATPDVVEWRTNWSYNSKKPFSEDDFDKNLRVDLEVSTGSIPTHGGGYVLKAYVYDTEEEANSSLEDSKKDSSNKAVYIYPQNDSGVEEMTSKEGSNGTEYYHNLDGISMKYAGKWIVFSARLSAGSGYASSDWVYSKAFQLPYVQLQTADVRSGQGEYDQEVTTDSGNMHETWKSKNTILEWGSVDYADAFEMKLVDADNLESNLRVVEDSKNHKVTVQEYKQVKEEKLEFDWVDIEGVSEDKTKKVVYEIGTYKHSNSSKYTNADGITINYQFDSYAQLEVTPEQDKDNKFTGKFTYTLKLPDVEGLTDEKGTNVMASLSKSEKKAFMPTESVTITSNLEENFGEEPNKQYVASLPFKFVPDEK